MKEFTNLPPYPPQHEHDCDNCIFLGTFWEGLIAWDCYFHPASREHPFDQRVARYGSKPEENMSVYRPVSAIDYTREYFRMEALAE